MPGIARIKARGEQTVYIVITRTALDGFVLEDVEKDFLLNLIKHLGGLYFAEIVGFCLMKNISTCWRECIRVQNTPMKRSGKKTLVKVDISGSSPKELSDHRDPRGQGFKESSEKHRNIGTL